MSGERFAAVMVVAGIVWLIIDAELVVYKPRAQKTKQLFKVLAGAIVVIGLAICWWYATGIVLKLGFE